MVLLLARVCGAKRGLKFVDLQSERRRDAREAWRSPKRRRESLSNPNPARNGWLGAVRLGAQSGHSVPYTPGVHHNRNLSKMGFLGRLYKVETLDTRFASKTGQRLPDAQPSKWNTPEYYLYYLCFLTIPFLMVKSVYDVSGPWHPSYKQYEGLLEPGWIPGRKVDNSDAQYRSFRDNIPYMALVVVLHPLLRTLYEKLTVSLELISCCTYSDPQQQASPEASSSASGSSNKVDTPNAIEARKESRIKFDLGFAAIFLLALHGISAAKVFLILYANFHVATSLPRQYVPAATWFFNIAILFANELCHGYPLADFASMLLPPQTSAAGEKPGNWGAWLDSYGGLIPRWEILFNVCVLRLISFNFDYYWSLDRRAVSPVEVSLTRTCHFRIAIKPQIKLSY